MYGGEVMLKSIGGSPSSKIRRASPWISAAGSRNSVRAYAHRRSSRSIPRGAASRLLGDRQRRAEAGERVEHESARPRMLLEEQPHQRRRVPDVVVGEL